MNSRIGAFLLPLFLLVQGCRLFNKVSKNDLSNQMKMEKSKVVWNETQWGAEMKSDRVLLELDSAEMGFFLEIWPKGPFSFSPQNGFLGEAEKVLLRGHALHKKAVSEVVNLAGSELASQKLQLQEKVVLQSNSKQQVVTSTPALKWILVLALFLAVVALAWFVRRA